MNKEALLWMLENAYVSVIFTKKDGSKRQMLCTLQKNELPEELEKPATKELGSKDELIKVWDVENNGWRSFYLKSILSISILGFTNVYSA